MVSKLFRIIKNIWQYKTNKEALIFWSVSLLLATVFQAYGFGINRITPRNFVENAGLIFILIGFSLFFKTKVKRTIQYFTFVIFCLNNLFESMYYYLFKANISASSFFILLETNTAEATEFFEYYIDSYTILMVITYFILIVFYLRKKPVFSIPRQIQYRKTFAAVALFLPLILMVLKGFEKYNFIYRGISSVFEYIAEQHKMNEFEIDRPVANIEGFQLIRQIDSATYVMVVGESTTRHRLSLYGYDRQTTPTLDSLKKDLWAYNDVISSHAYTIESLRKTLVTNNLQSKDDFSIIQMMNEAGFKTFWISNQKPIGQFESLTTKVALASDVYIVKNLADHKTVTPYDEILLPEFRKVLKDKAKKKFIVLHLLGTHLAYEKRYPKAFQKFNGKSPSNFDHDIAHMRFNAYDNAILYLDHILKNIISELDKIDHNSYLLYFSDHGDEVYESIDFAGHAEEYPTRSMYEVPFFLWMNSQFRQNMDKTYYPDKPYMLENLIYTLSDLNGIDFKANDSTRSIFFKTSKQEKRLLGNGKYYEQLEQ